MHLIPSARAQTHAHYEARKIGDVVNQDVVFEVPRRGISRSTYSNRPLRTVFSSMVVQSPSLFISDAFLDGEWVQ